MSSSADVPPDNSQNIAQALHAAAELVPFQRAVVFPESRDALGRVMYSHLTFQQLDQETDRLARGLIRLGVRPGMRLVLMVRPSLEFIALTFAIFKAGGVVVLIDPGMGPKAVFRCLEQVDPEGFIAIPFVHLARRLKRKRFPNAKLNVVVGRFGRLPTYRTLLGEPWGPVELPAVQGTDPAGIIFTSGSTGPAKGVLYEHGMFSAQARLIRDRFDIWPGEIDLPGFPLFALFNAAMGVTTVIPEMDPTRPARVNPERILEAIQNQGVTQSFGSPAIWNRVGRYCAEKKIQIPSLKRILCAGAPVPVPVIETLMGQLTEPGGELFTPYGATEALPIAAIGSSQILSQTAALSRKGAGTCVGTPFPETEVKIIRITDDPIADWSGVEELPAGEIGEITVRSPCVTREYYRQPEATRAAKIPDGDTFWHRMGDVGYLDPLGQLWFCGRKAHRVETGQGTLFSEPCEGIFNTHPQVFRSALVGVGKGPNQRPVIVIETEKGQFPRSRRAKKAFVAELLSLARQNAVTASIETVLFHSSFPVDVRHNFKIFREKLALWAQKKLRWRR
ncbi:MAG: fatty acid CoA ligase family protein [Planctomycetales bacterium]